MVWTVWIAALVAAVVAEGKCGEFGQRPCASPFCLLDLTQHVTPSGLCKRCGFDGEAPCSSKPACGYGSGAATRFVLVKGVCRKCGDLGAPACKGSYPCNAPIWRNADGICKQCGNGGDPPCPLSTGLPGGCSQEFGNSAPYQGVCTGCGFTAQPPACPEPNPCPYDSSGTSIVVDNTCIRCGVSGAPVCPGNKCTEGVPVNNRCVKCGKDGQPLCENATKCAKGYALLNSKCVLCGGDGQPACAGGKCTRASTSYQGHIVVDDNQICQFCGWFAERPCAGSKPCPGIDRQTTSIVVNGLCTECGFDQEPACSDGSCGTTTLVNIGGVCQRCGDPDQPVCQGPARPCSFSPHIVVGGVCKECGGEQQIPCAGGLCPNVHDFVGGQSPYVVYQGLCTLCGFDGPACTGPCKSYYGYVRNKNCARCGLGGRPICPDGTCARRGLVKRDGRCYHA